MKKILCFDFDGVIHSYTSGWQGPRTIPDPPVPGAIDYLHRALNRGFDVVICSSRARYFGGRWAMRRWLCQHAGNLFYDAPGIRGLEEVRFVKAKPPALLTIDDRAMTFCGRWPPFEVVEHFQPWNRRPAPTLGPTGDYPGGRFCPDDEGGLELGLAANSGRVIVRFGAPVEWIGLRGADARELAAALTDKAAEAEQQEAAGLGKADA